MKYIILLSLLMMLIIVNVGCSSTSHLDVTIDSSIKNTLVFSGNGNGGNDLYLINLSTNKVNRLTDTPDNERTPSFDSTGDFVVYTASLDSEKGSQLYIQSVNGGARRQITFDKTAYDLFPRFSRDGTKIIFCRANKRRPYSMGGYTWDDYDIYIIDVNGENLKQITKQKFGIAISPNFTDNEKQIIFSGSMRGSNGSKLYLVDITNSESNIREIGDGSEPMLSRNGKMIAFISDRKIKYEYQVWTSDTNNKQREEITSFRAYKTSPVFKQDDYILFLSDTTGHSQPELWQVGIDGINSKKVADSELFSNPMKWKP